MQSFSRLKKIFLGACFTWSSNWHLIMLRLIRVRNENVSFEQTAVLEMGVIAHRHSKKLIYPQSALTPWVPSTTLFWKVLKQIKLSLFFLFAFIFKRPSPASLRHNFLRFYIFLSLVRMFVLLYFWSILVDLTHKHMANEWDPKQTICGQIGQFSITMGVKLLNKEKWLLAS